MPLNLFSSSRCASCVFSRPPFVPSPRSRHPFPSSSSYFLPSACRTRSTPAAACPRPCPHTSLTQSVAAVAEPPRPVKTVCSCTSLTPPPPSHTQPLQPPVPILSKRAVVHTPHPHSSRSHEPPPPHRSSIARCRTAASCVLPVPPPPHPSLCHATRCLCTRAATACARAPRQRRLSAVSAAAEAARPRCVCAGRGPRVPTNATPRPANLGVLPPRHHKGVDMSCPAAPRRSPHASSPSLPSCARSPATQHRCTLRGILGHATFCAGS